MRRIARAHCVVRDPLLQHATANIRKYLFVTYTKYLFFIVTDVTSFSIFVRAPKNCRFFGVVCGVVSGRYKARAVPKTQIDLDQGQIFLPNLDVACWQ